VISLSRGSLSRIARISSRVAALSRGFTVAIGGGAITRPLRATLLVLHAIDAYAASRLRFMLWRQFSLSAGYAPQSPFALDRPREEESSRGASDGNCRLNATKLCAVYANCSGSCVKSARISMNGARAWPVTIIGHRMGTAGGLVRGPRFRCPSLDRRIDPEDRAAKSKTSVRGESRKRPLNATARRRGTRFRREPSLNSPTLRNRV